MFHTPHIPMDDAHLANYAANAARELTPVGRYPVRRMRRSTRSYLLALGRIYRSLLAWSAHQEALPPAVEWLLDNYYLAVQEGRDGLEALQCVGALRGTKGGVSLLEECVHGMLWAAPDLDRGRLTCYLEAFQTVQPLTERELSLLAPVLSGALVEQLARLCKDQEGLRRGKGDPEDFAAVFAALRTLGSIQWGAVLEEVSRVERILRQDPSGDYPRMDERTRCRYRQQVCRLAKRYRKEECQTAQAALDLARQGEEGQRHIGWYLYRQPMGEEPVRLGGRTYGAAVLGLALALGLAVWRLSGAWWTAALLLLPLSDVTRRVLDFVLVRLVPPRPVHRMECEQGIPAEGRTLCVVVSLLTGVDSGPELAARLERYCLANRDAGEELRFGLLVDLPDSDTPMDEEGQSWLDSARQAVDGLNRRYGGGFYLLFRRPRYSARDGRYMGWERKRGALTELVRLLKGRPSGVEVAAGERSGLRGVQYIITLDADTNLNVGTARELVGAMLHPLNRPVIDGGRRVVTAGHALFQPRVAVDLEGPTALYLPGCLAGQGVWTPMALRSATSTTTCLTRGATPARASFRWTPFSPAWTADFRTTRSCPTICWRAATSAPGCWGRWS